MNYKNLRFEICDEFASADFIFDAYGKDLNELFAACGAACFSAMTDLDRVNPSRNFAFEIKGENPEELLFNYISELVYLKDVEKILFSEFNIEIAPDLKSLKAGVAGEPIDYDKHALKTDVKAATYHNLEITKNEGGYKVRMILDL